LYDDWRSVEERGVGGATQANYVFGTGIDELIQIQKTAAAPSGAGTLFAHQNARGDVAALTDAAGAVVERTLFDDFGSADRASTVGNPFGFQGARLDIETGLYWFRNRYYDPNTGRFTSRDPVWDPG